MTDVAPSGEPIAETRSDRRKRRNRQAVIDAAYRVMSEKGIDAATMSEIADAADLGAGTVYNYFSSKDDLAIAVIEQVMADLAKRIEAVTHKFEDPALCYAFGIRNVLRSAISDHRWRTLLRRAEVMAGAMYRVLGPYATRDIRLAVSAGRYSVSNIDLVWRLTSHAIVGFGLSVCEEEFSADVLDEVIVDLLGMVGVMGEAAWALSRYPFPPLPGESGPGERRREGRKKVTDAQK